MDPITLVLVAVVIAIALCVLLDDGSHGNSSADRINRTTGNAKQEIDRLSGDFRKRR